MSGANGHKGTPRAGKKTYSARVVAQAMALMIAGESVQAVADQLKIPPQTISEWKSQFPANFGAIRTKKEVIEDLLGEYLEEILRTNLAQLKVFADEKWVKSQGAYDLATLHGVLFDKAIRIFDAARRGAEQRQLPAASGDTASETFS